LGSFGGGWVSGRPRRGRERGRRPASSERWRVLRSFGNGKGSGRPAGRLARENLAVCGWGGTASFTANAVSPQGWRLLRIQAAVCGSWKCITRQRDRHHHVSRGHSTLYLLGSRKSGRAKYAPLRGFTGGRPGRPLGGKKRKHGRLRFFYLTAPDHGEGAVPPPLSRGRTGLRPERSEAERREQTRPICFRAGEARRRGGGTIYFRL
jgi:hypothetical protein